MSNAERQAKLRLDERVADRNGTLLGYAIYTDSDGKVQGYGSVAYRNEDASMTHIVGLQYKFGEMWLMENFTSVSDASLDKLVALRG